MYKHIYLSKINTVFIKFIGPLQSPSSNLKSASDFVLVYVLTERKLASKWSRVMNMSTSSTRPPSCMYCLGEFSRTVGTPANMLLPSERDSASSNSNPPPRARFLIGGERERERERGGKAMGMKLYIYIYIILLGR